MTITLRDYQQVSYDEITAYWAMGVKNVLYVAPCRSGKTVVMAKAINDNTGASIAVAHRSELLQQMSMTLANLGIFHKIIGPAALGKACAQEHVAELGRSFISPQARCYVASAQTLAKCEHAPWMNEITLWITDEAHHYYRENSWTKSLAHFVNSRGLGVTATPIGAGGMGLGKHADGLMEAMVLGIESRELIRRGFLTDYKIVAPESDIDLSQIAVSSSGEYSPKPLADAVHKSKTIVGDVVSTYLKFTPGKLGMTFCVDIEAATEMALAFRKAGVPAEVLSGKTMPSIRRHVQQQHKQKKILQICSVDLYGEGIDVPDLEVVSFARPTNSLGLYIQQFWRPGNPRHDKPRFWVLDHVGNVRRHMLPDAPRTWTLDRREKRSSSGPKDDVIPLRTCLNPECLTVYERIYPQCPECGHIPPIAARGTPEAVDGELLEMSPELLVRLRGEIDKPLVVPYSAPAPVKAAVTRRYFEAFDAQVSLRESMAMWGGCWNEPDGIKQRRFFHTFGCDVMTAMGLNKADALILQDKVDNAVSKR